jgi:thiamine monophosphate synthase
LRLEDALLYFVAEPGGRGAGALGRCASAIGAGVDVVHAADWPAEALGLLADLCKREEVLLVVQGEAASAEQVAADGVHLADITESIGLARSEHRPDTLVGMSTRSFADLAMAVEVGADFVLHWAGNDCPAAFSAYVGAAHGVLFAAGFDDLEGARAIVEQGVLRLCVQDRMFGDGDIGGAVAEYSRLLGRCI